MIKGSFSRSYHSSLFSLARKLMILLVRKYHADTQCQLAFIPGQIMGRTSNTRKSPWSILTRGFSVDVAFDFHLRLSASSADALDFITAAFRVLSFVSGREK